METEKTIECPNALKGLYDDGRPKKVYYGGRGGAKSTTFADALLIQGMTEKMRILCAREIQKSIKYSVYSLLADRIKLHGFDSFYNIKADGIEGVNGTEFIFIGLQTHTVESLKSITNIRRCWVEEARSVSDRSWEVLIPSLFRIPDCQLWLSFNTGKVTDPTYIRFVQQADEETTLVKKVSWRDNPWFPPDLDRERRTLEKSDPESYAHVWEGEPDTRHNGSVYAKWVDRIYNTGRTKEGLYDPSIKVDTFWDLGWSDSTSIIFTQRVGNEPRVIDCFESFNEDMEFYANILDSRGYKYGKHYGPSDVTNKLLAAGGKSIFDVARKSGINFVVWPETTHAQRIEALRTFLGTVWIDPVKCRDLIHSLMNYQFKYNDDLNIFSSEPVHDWSSHFSTAAELMARVFQDEIVHKKTGKIEPISFIGDGNKVVGKINIKEYIARKQRERDD